MTWKNIYDRSRLLTPNATSVMFHSGVENWVKVYSNCVSFHVDGSIRSQMITEEVPEFVKYKFGWKEVEND